MVCREWSLLVRRGDFAAAIAVADVGVEELALGGRGIEIVSRSVPAS